MKGSPTTALFVLSFGFYSEMTLSCSETEVGSPVKVPIVGFGAIQISYNPIMLEKQDIKLLPLVAFGVGQGIFKYYVKPVLETVLHPKPLEQYIGELANSEIDKLPS